jgi:hypothetical protein
MDNIEKLRNMVAIQGASGNYDYNAYMFGMYVGLLLALSTIEGSDYYEPIYPDTWLEELKVDTLDPTSILF